MTADATFSSPDMTTAGEKTVTVTYEGKETTGTITVNEAGNPGEGTTYTATITTGVLKVLDSSQSSTYAKYKGVQSVTAVGSDGSSVTVEFSITDVMPATGGNAGKIQLKKGTGEISADGWGTIKSVTPSETALTVTETGTGFSVKNGTSGVAYMESLTVVFEK